MIERTLHEHGGNISRAARVLGVSRGLLYRRMRGWSGPA
ncbi:helix-turn-helix domain-containing protein [Rubrivivax sp. RP6-9]